MQRKTLRQQKTGSPESSRPFRILFIWMSGPLRDPMVRVVLVGTNGARDVYEGMKPWSKCKHWIGQLRSTAITEEEFTQVCETFVRAQFATIKEAQASLDDLKSLGLHRADR
jgi:hypothetical protein